MIGMLKRVKEWFTGRRSASKSLSWSALWLQAREHLFGGAELRDPLAQHIWVYACVMKIARNVSAVPYVLWSGDRRLTLRMRHGAALSLFQYAEPGLVGPQIWERTAAHMVYYGYAVWYPVMGRGGVPARLHVIRPSDIQPIRQGDVLVGWQWKQRQLGPGDVLVLPMFKHGDDLLGLGPFSVARETAETDYKAMKWVDGIIDNRGDPGGILYTEEALDEEYVKTLRERWNARHAGPGKAGGLAVLDNGLRYERVGMTAEELEYLDLRRYTREDICAAFGVPQALLGVTEDVNYATHRALKRIFWEETIWPLLNHIQALVQYYVLDVYFPGVRGEFDVGEILELQRDVPQEVKSARVLFEMGFTANELNDWFRWGFDKKPWRDQPFVPANLAGVGEDAGRPQVNPDYPGPTDDEPPADYDSEPSVDREVLDEVLRAVRKRLKRRLFEVRGYALEHGELPGDFADKLAFDVAKLFGLGGVPDEARAACKVVRKFAGELDEAVRSSGDVKRVLNWTASRLGVVIQRMRKEICDEE